MRRAAAGLAVAAALAAAPAGAAGAPALVELGHFSFPVHAAGPAGDPDRLFVVEKAGVVRLLVDGVAMAEPFADLTAEVDDSDERGLLSIAFPADYAESGRFYLFATAADGAFPDAQTGDIVILEGTRSAANPNRADDAFRVVAKVDHPSDIHVGGQLAFGPDGALYASVGDGGPQGDPDGHAQDPASPLGKILRIADPTSGAAPEIWALGLRNPWRFSFDRVNGDLWIGDVGWETREEIDRVAFAEAAGANFGWNLCEGDVGELCDLPGLTAPLIALPREHFRTVIGGFVVRDPLVPSLQGRYVFGDGAQPAVLAADAVTGAYDPLPSLAVTQIVSFGEDGCGRIHVVTPGAVRRIDELEAGGCAPATPVPGTPPPGGGPPPPAGEPPAPDTTAPGLLVVRGRRHVRAFVVKLRADEPVRARVTARGYRTRRVDLPAGVTTRVRVEARRRTIRRLRGRERVVRSVDIRAADAAGNVARRTLRLRLR
jgi:hypothetical protein